jgi:hypothetical protein
MGASMRFSDLPRRGKNSVLIAVSMIVLIFFWGWQITEGGTSSVTARVHDTVMPYAKSVFDHLSPPSRISTLDLLHLQPHIKTQTFKYARRTIRTKQVAMEREDLTRVNETLFGSPLILDKENLTSITVASPPVLELRVPLTPKADTSIMAFGMATKIPRLQQAIPQLAHWLPHTEAQVHVIAPAHDDDLPVERSIRKLGIDLTITSSDLPFPKAYFSIIKKLYETRNPQTKWLVMMDDDTFIPSLPYLVKHLEKNYDASEQVMVAATSDNLKQVQSWGLIPFGGGGIFVSVPLAAALVKPEVWHACMNSTKDQGDQIVNECLNYHSAIRPTFDLGLHQMDISGDSAGYFESGRRLLTVHHWKTWFDFNVPMAANVSKACGQECVFQRWLFDENTVLSNGFSIVDYPKGINETTLGQVEKTWEGEMWMFYHKIGPLREPLQKEEKKAARLVEASIIPQVGVRQVYIESADGVANGMDRVEELLWLF